MKRDIRKQIWLTVEDCRYLQINAERCCLTEAEYIRMLLHSRVPKEKPDAEFYEAMNQLNEFSNQVDVLFYQLKLTGSCNTALLQNEIHRWHQFQLAIEERFLAPEKVSWL